MEKKHNVPFRLLTYSEFERICPITASNNDEIYPDPYTELDFFYENKKLENPVPFVSNFDDLIMKYKKPLCKPPQKLYYLKQNNLDKINQENSCERVSSQRHRS